MCLLLTPISGLITRWQILLKAPASHHFIINAIIPIIWTNFLVCEEMCLFENLYGERTPVPEFNCATSYKGVGRNGCLAPCILNLDTQYKLVVMFTPRPLFLQGKNSCTDETAGFLEPQSLSGRFEEDSNVVNLSQESNPDFSVILTVA